jgi:tetratricopeptide (TPR) repeat protein
VRYLLEDNSNFDGLLAIEELLRTRAEMIDKQCSGLNPADALQFESLGAMFADIGEHPRAIKYFTKALSLFEEHREQQNPAITLTDTTQTTLQLALAMASVEKKAEAISMLINELDKFESFLGPNHNEVHIVLEALMTWAHDIQDFDRAKSLHERVIAIEKTVGNSLQQRTTPKPMSCPPECEKYLTRPVLKK